MTNEQRNIIEQLMLQHSAKMIQLAIRKTGSRQLAEDMVQETFTRACDNADDVCGHENPYGWLQWTLHWVILQEMDRAYHERELPLDEIEDFGKEMDFSTLKDYLPRELSDEEVTLLLLHYGHQLTHAEIAERQGIQETACRKRVSRALAKCRKYLKEKNKF